MKSLPPYERVQLPLAIMVGAVRFELTTLSTPC
jgi:hypothetical protein